MKPKPAWKAAVVVLFCLLVQTVAYEGARPEQSSREPSARDTRGVKRGPIKSLSGETFSLARSLESPTTFNLAVSDGDERVVSGQLTLEQLQALAAIMREAKEFAFTEEAASTSEPITTRFSSEQEPSFEVDVMKFGDQSHFFITVGTETGRITIGAGVIKRRDKKEAGFYFDILSQLESLVATPPARSSK